MRSIAATLILLGAGACELNEGPSEEAREAQEAIADGRNPDRMQNAIAEADAAADGGTVSGDQDPLNYDRELDEAEAWLADARREIEAGTRAANAPTNDVLDDIEKNIKEARGDLDRLADQAADERQRLEAKVRQAIAEIDAATTRIDAAGEPGDPE